MQLEGKKPEMLIEFYYLYLYESGQRRFVAYINTDSR